MAGLTTASVQAREGTGWGAIPGRDDLMKGRSNTGAGVQHTKLGSQTGRDGRNMEHGQTATSTLEQSIQNKSICIR